MKKQISKNFLLRNVRKVIPYAKPYWLRIILFVALVFPLGSSDVLITYGLKRLIDGLQNINQVEQTIPFTVWLMPILVIGFAVVQGLLQYFTSYLNAWIGNKIANDVKIEMFRKLLSLDPYYFDNNNSGEILMRYYNDPESACRDLLNQLKDLISRSITVGSLACYLIFLSWKLAIVALLMLALTMVPVGRLRKKITQLVGGVVNVSARIITNYNETFSGIKTILVYNLQKFQILGLKNKLNEFFNLQMKMTQRMSWLPPSMHIIASIGIGITVGYGTFLVLTKNITLGALVSFATSLFLIYNPIKALGSCLASLQQAMFAVDRIFNVLEMSPNIKDPEIGKIFIPKEEFKLLEFDGVSFAYRKDRKVLDNVSFSLSAGESLALVGNSGGGKTTITNLLMRFYDVVSGEIKINGINIRNWKLHDLHQQMAVVFQDNFLFEGTVADNLLVGKLTASKEEMWEALSKACLDDFVKNLPDKLNTQIGEHGVLLSGGQKQRLAIARAFLKNAPIIILDEATSALDNHSEAMIQQAIYNLTQQKTVIVIAHRLSTIQHVDKILVVQQGKIVERGTHEELLLNSKGVYRSLYDVQFRDK